MLIEEMDGEYSYYLMVLTGQVYERCYYQVYRVDELSYGTSYSNATMVSKGVLGVWQNSGMFYISKLNYYNKNQMFVFTVVETGLEDSYHTLLFDKEMNKLQMPSFLGYMDQYVFSKEENKVILEEEEDWYCSYTYQLSQTALSIEEDSKNCLHTSTFLSLKDEYLEI